MKLNWNKLFTASLLITATSITGISHAFFSQKSIVSQKSTVTQNDKQGSNQPSELQKLTIENCHVKGIRQQVQCGTLVTPENYAKPNGENININFVVLPAIDNSKDKLPLMFLAGGPGQAASELAGMLYARFNEIRKTRDLILIDQRGTGESHPIKCEDVEDINPYSLLPEDLKLTDIEKCIGEFKGDLSQYSSENAIRDFDAVRQALGHQQVHIYGGSYGTRAGLVYMRMFPDSLKSVVLDSVGPIEVPIGLVGKSAEQSFDQLLVNCQTQASCAKQYPNIAKEFTAVKAKLANAPVSVTISHPRLGTPTEFIISQDKFISNIQMQLYGLPTRSLVPLVIHQAYLGDYKPLAGLISQAEGGMGVYLGLHFNIVCNEDLPKIDAQMKIENADNNFAGAMALDMVAKVCSVWPKYQPSSDFYQTVTANIPTLILSGSLDPVTPPSNGEISHSHLPNSHHIVSKNNAHIVASTACGVDIVNEFLEKQTPTELDESCLKELPNESFMIGLNGGAIVEDKLEITTDVSAQSDKE